MGLASAHYRPEKAPLCVDQSRANEPFLDRTIHI